MVRFREAECRCSLCGADAVVEGHWHGDGWNEPREFEPFDDPVLCQRCKEGDEFTITLKVVGYEDFSKMRYPGHWQEALDEFDSVHVYSVEVKKHERKD